MGIVSGGGRNEDDTGCLLVTEVITVSTTTLLHAFPRSDAARVGQWGADADTFFNKLDTGSRSRIECRKLKAAYGEGLRFPPFRTLHLLLRRCLAIFLGLSLSLFILAKFMSALLLLSSARLYYAEDLYMDLHSQLHMMASSKERHGSEPMLIPKVMHQMHQIYLPGLPRDLHYELSGSWKLYNGRDWEYRFYDDAASLALVKGEFPDYLKAYLSLSKVERSVFFRYMVVLRYGGVFADMAVECRRPLESVIKSTDTMVVGWEADMPTDEQAQAKGLARRRQIHQWFFAAAPGHPALREVCDRFAESVMRSLPNESRRAMLERSGNGIWTDVILKHALTQQNMGKSGHQPWPIRVLPRVAFLIAGDLPSYSPQTVVVRHHHLEQMESLTSWACFCQWLLERIVSRLNFFQPSQATTGASDLLLDPIYDKSSRASLFPVSVDFEPAFTMMVNMAGHGDLQWSEDVSLAITAWGTWQASIALPSSSQAPPRKPLVIDAIIGALGNRSTRSVLVDVGAAQGLFSVAAASRGHRAIAFETSGLSLASMRASIRYNGLDSLVDLHEIPLGARSETICLRRRSMLGLEDAADVDTRRGYGDPSLHAMSNPLLCEATAQRRTLPEALGLRTLSTAPAAEDREAIAGPGLLTVGALRLSANGHEGWILDGAEEWMKQSPPSVILVEFAPVKIRRSGFSNPERILKDLHALGYSYIAHAGHVCDGRWKNLTGEVGQDSVWERSSSLDKMSMSHQDMPHHSTWCRLKPDSFHALVNGASATGVPENVLFIHKTHRSSFTPTAL